jgi:hypothetical protein
MTILFLTLVSEPGYCFRVLHVTVFLPFMAVLHHTNAHISVVQWQEHHRVLRFQSRVPKGAEISSKTS